MKDNTPIREAFIKSTINVLDTLCQYRDIEYITQKTEHSEQNDIIGIMGINGNIVGSTMIIIAYEDAVKVISRMTGMEPDELSRLEIGLGIAELLNIISGNAKTILSGSEFAFNLTVPRVITCRDYHINDDEEMQSVFVTFNNSEMKMQVCVSYNLQKKSSDITQKIECATTK